ncbi:MAG: hypothetical protein CM15mP64_4940 [Candidatus Neomarinimicrobiota bacterium]|nr:MAG: hypothetical protein CM15mP64_4940 [Candidatus Neomarinimicrobiota bacterium]
MREKLPVNIPGNSKNGHGITIEMKEKKSKILQPQTWTRNKAVIPYEANPKYRKRVLFTEKKAIQNKAWPGSVFPWTQRGKKFFIHKTSGFHTYDKKKVRKSDIFDLASITKRFFSTTSAILKLF